MRNRPFAETEHRSTTTSSAQAEAVAIKSYDTQVITGLLQTEAYAREVIDAGYAGRTPDQRVATRMQRQRILERRDPPRIWVMLDEPALDRVVGGREVMREQFQRLLRLADVPTITIQVIPWEPGAHAGLNGSFHLLALEDGADVAYVEAPGAGWFVDQPDLVADYSVRHDLIRASALPVSAAYVRASGTTQPDE
jgi:hypothetical protein